MPGPLLHVGAVVGCAHGGQAQPSAPNPKVLVNGQPIVMQPMPHVVGGCALPPNAGGPCVTAQWVTGATRVLSYGQSVLLMDSQAISTPTGTPLFVTGIQTRVTGM
jgi:hypothetical protein